MYRLCNRILFDWRSRSVHFVPPGYLQQQHCVHLHRRLYGLSGRHLQLQHRGHVQCNLLAVPYRYLQRPDRLHVCCRLHGVPCRHVQHEHRVHVDCCLPSVSCGDLQPRYGLQSRESVQGTVPRIPRVWQRRCCVLGLHLSTDVCVVTLICRTALPARMLRTRV